MLLFEAVLPIGNEFIAPTRRVDQFEALDTQKTDRLVEANQALLRTPFASFVFREIKVGFAESAVLLGITDRAALWTKSALLRLTLKHKVLFWAVQDALLANQSVLRNALRAASGILADRAAFGTSPTGIQKGVIEKRVATSLDALVVHEKIPWFALVANASDHLETVWNSCIITTSR